VNTARTLNTDEVMEVWRLGNCENFVGWSQCFVVHSVSSWNDINLHPKVIFSKLAQPE